VVLTTHLLLAPRSGKSRAIPLPPLWAFGPVTVYLYLFKWLTAFNLILPSFKSSKEVLCNKNKIMI
jgi:hypothetical protein